MFNSHFIWILFPSKKQKRKHSKYSITMFAKFCLRVKVKLFRTTMELNHLLIISQDTCDYSLYGPPNKQAGKNRTVFHLYNSNGIGGLEKMKELTFWSYWMIVPCFSFTWMLNQHWQSWYILNTQDLKALPTKWRTGELSNPKSLKLQWKQ